MGNNDDLWKKIEMNMKENKSSLGMAESNLKNMRSSVSQLGKAMNVNFEDRLAEQSTALATSGSKKGLNRKGSNADLELMHEDTKLSGNILGGLND